METTIITSLAKHLLNHGSEHVKFTAVNTDRVEAQHSNNAMQKGDTMDCLEKKYETSPENVINQSSRFDISGNRVIREHLVLSPTFFSTENDSCMVTVSNLGGMWLRR